MADTAPDVYTEFVKLLLEAEATRRTALEDKGGAVISTSGTLVTLLFGLVAVVTGADTFTLPGASHGWLIAAIVLFAVASLIAILISVPLPYGQTDITAAMLASWWSQPPAQAQAAVSGVRLQALAAARRMNAIKARILIAATLFELVAVAMLGVAVVFILDR
ncbi:MAG TPA: hypothetical protein VF612_03370 [Jatrophihabitans sp.]|jgi:hypothetical protein|uniref:hypothetical protein n=1 Tax=Jatrophihabitans sp. TaxID=1932789 RepID=UPI002F021645